MAGPDRRNKPMLASAGALRWTGRRIWRSFFAVLLVLALVVNVLTLTSDRVFERLSMLWQDATGAQTTVLQRFDARVTDAESAAAAARAEAARLLAELTQAREVAATLQRRLTDAEALAADLTRAQQRDRFLLRRAERRVQDLRAELSSLQTDTAQEDLVD